MNHYTGRLIEVLLEPYQNASLRLSLPSAAQPRPGEYLLANRANSAEEALSLTLFPALVPSAEGQPETIALLSASRQTWQPGDELALSTPRGRPFILPKRAERLLFWSLSASPAWLLPFISLALESHRQVVLLTNEPEAGIPVEVEIQPLSALRDLLTWAQAFVLHSPIRPTPEALEELPRPLRKQGYLYATGEFPCGGQAECGLCTLKLDRKDVLPCKAGPLLPLKDWLS